MGELHLMQRDRLAERHCVLLQKLLEENSHKKKYWILGWTDIKRKNGKTRIMPKMMAVDTKPDVSKESYLYEVDNEANTRELLWVMHPNNKLSIPSVGKIIQVAAESGV